MEARKRKLPEWMLSPQKSVEVKVKDKEASDPDSWEDLFEIAVENEERKRKEKPVTFIMSPKELEEVALEILSESN